MKNYSSNVASPDQVKNLIDEVDARQSEQIEHLNGVVKIMKTVGAIVIVAVIAMGVQVMSLKSEVSAQRATVAVPAAATASK
jgi:hypothetical protein